MKTLISKTIFAVMAVAAFTLVPVLAEPAEPAPSPACLMLEADANNDGDVTFEELSATCPNITREKFDQRDRNTDGVLNDADRPARAGQGKRQGPRDGKGWDQSKAQGPGQGQGQGPGQGAGPARKGLMSILAEADADGNGKVTYDEVKTVRPQFPQEAFDRMDRNHDGILSKDDRGAPGEGDRAGRAQHFRERLRAADTNGDQQVTWEEAQAAMPKMTKERFDKLDKNGDGAISPADRQQPSAQS